MVSNALLIKAYAPEVKLTVDASCCAGVSPEKHLAALETMSSVFHSSGKIIDDNSNF